MNSVLRHLASTALVAAVTVAGSSVAFDAEYTAKIGHLESTQQSRHVHLEKVAELVAERTDGAVEFQIFPQGQLGSQREMNEGVQLGVLEATVAPAAFLGGFNPAVSILDIPFLLPEDDATAPTVTTIVVTRPVEAAATTTARIEARGMVLVTAPCTLTT